MRKILLSAAALVAMTGFAMADSTEAIIAGANTVPLSAKEMSTITGTDVDISNSNIAANYLSQAAANINYGGSYVNQNVTQQAVQTAVAGNRNDVDVRAYLSSRVYQRNR